VSGDAIAALLGAVEQYEAVLCFAGVVALAAAWAPAYLESRPLSLPIVLIAIGMVVFGLPLGLPLPDPLEHVEVTERVTELGVIVALTGAGLGIDRPIGWRRWGPAWRLLAIAMPLFIAAVALLGWAVLGLSAAGALLLGAALAPTDPVLAADVQVGEPTIESAVDPDGPGANRRNGAEVGDGGAPGHGGEAGGEDVEDDVRVALTAEAGLNDGLAFPFVYAAIALAGSASNGAWLPRWIAVDLGLRVVVGVAAGFLVGRLLSRVFFDPPGRLAALADAADGFVALAATFLAYGLTEIIGGYGFLAVFVAAVTVRTRERRHEYHRVLHGFSAQVEHLIVVALLVVLGGVVVRGGLAGVDVSMVAVAVLGVLVVRPIVGRLALVGADVTPPERRAMAFFGIRGIGSLYYVAYAIRQTDFIQARTIWTTVLVAVLVSVVVHGVAATPVMRRLDERRSRARSRSRRRAARAVVVDDAPAQRATPPRPGTAAGRVVTVSGSTRRADDDEQHERDGLELRGRPGSGGRPRARPPVPDPG
jgi:NhaP-type Na+/H+ or K+/H+ antiporter